MKTSDDRKKKEIIQRIESILRFFDPNQERYYLGKEIGCVNKDIHTVEILSPVVEGTLWVIHFDTEGKLGRVHNMPTDDELLQRIDELRNQE